MQPSEHDAQVQDAQSLAQSHDAHILVTHDAPAAGGASPGAALMGQLPLLIAIVAIFYFLIIRPQNQERKRHEELLASLKRDDEVITAAGLHGRVVQVQDARVELELAPKVRVWVEKSSVQRKRGEPASADAKGDDAKKGS